MRKGETENHNESVPVIQRIEHLLQIDAVGISNVLPQFVVIYLDIFRIRTHHLPSSAVLLAATHVALS